MCDVIALHSVMALHVETAVRVIILLHACLFWYLACGTLRHIYPTHLFSSRQHAELSERTSANPGKCHTCDVRAVCTFFQTGGRKEGAKAGVACAGIPAQESVPLLLSECGPPLHEGLLHRILICMCMLL